MVLRVFVPPWFPFRSDLAGLVQDLLTTEHKDTEVHREKVTCKDGFEEFVTHDVLFNLVRLKYFGNA